MLANAMPSRPPVHQPLGAEAIRRARADRQAERLAARPSASLRGYDAEWRVARKLHLLAHPACSVAGCQRPATDVDHIEGIADAPHRRLDPTNFRSMCHQHHAQRTARDQGFARPGGTGPRGARHPDWLGPSKVPLHVVCGPPGSGKTRFVQDRATKRDLVLDLDEIAAMISCTPIYHAPPAALDPALRWRNQHLKLCSIRRAWPAAWLIVSEPKAKWRQWWRETLMPVRIVVMEEAPATCIDRIRADERRPEPVRRVHEDAVVQWWGDYTRLPDDHIMREGQRPTTGASRA